MQGEGNRGKIGQRRQGRAIEAREGSGGKARVTEVR